MTDVSPTLNSVRPAWYVRYWRELTLLALPILITLVNPNWLYNPDALNVADTWYYHGLFRGFPAFAANPDTNFTYFIERLGWVLPGYALYQTFPAEIANIILDFCVYLLAIFSVYAIVKRLFGADVALLTALCLGGYTWFLRAVGHDYLDGVGTAYYAAAWAFAIEAVYWKRYKLALFISGLFVGLTLSTQLIWVAFLPLIGLAYVALNDNNERRPVILSGLWIGVGAAVVLIGLTCISGLMVGKWNIFSNSIQFIRASSGVRDWILDTIAWYRTFPMMWMVIPCGTALLAVWVLWSGRWISETQRLHLRLVAGFFAATLLIFIGLHYSSAFQYLYIYLYMSMSIPATFILLAGVIAGFNLPVITPRQAVIGLTVSVLPYLLVLLIPPLTMWLTQPIWVWAGISVVFAAMIIWGIRGKSPSVWVGGIALISLLCGGGNGVSYPDRLQNYRLFAATNQTLDTIAGHLSQPIDFSQQPVWFETRDYLSYAAPIRYLFWGSIRWFDIRQNPADERLLAHAVQDIVMLSDTPDIVERVRNVLGGLFEVEVITDFSLPITDPTGQYRGYILRLRRIDGE